MIHFQTKGPGDMVWWNAYVVTGLLCL